MLGMVIAHYAWQDDTGGVLNQVAEAVDGRAMPLFVLLGGVGATILARRSAVPDRSLLIRAAILYPLGLVVQELTTFIAIILQSYSLLFALTPVFRRLGNRVLLGLAAAVTTIGGWTYQVVGPDLDRFDGPMDLLTNPPTALWSLLFNGYYPFFPVASFFLVGMYLGRTDLRSTGVARALAIGGSVIGLGALIVGGRLAERLGPVVTDPPTNDGRFSAVRLLDTSGHSEMPAWVISTAGTSMAILGLSLLVAPRLPGLVRPLVALGQLALSFYVFQAVLVRILPHPNQTPIGQEFVAALAVYIGFTVFAMAWKLRFRSGPLEAGLRIGSRPRRQTVRPERATDT